MNENVKSTRIAICSLVISLVTLCITIFTFKINFHESLRISYQSDGEITKIHWDKNNNLRYTISITFCLVNCSNVPIYIDDCTVNYNKISPSVAASPIIQYKNTTLPFYIKPQDTQYLPCKIDVYIPQEITEMIIGNYSYYSKMPVAEIRNYLFFQNYTDLNGNSYPATVDKDEITTYKYNIREQFLLCVHSSRNNVFKKTFCNQYNFYNESCNEKVKIKQKKEKLWNKMKKSIDDFFH